MKAGINREPEKKDGMEVPADSIRVEGEEKGEM
jgi:hypothetical protein